MRLRSILPVALVAASGCATLPPGACDPRNADVSLIHKMQCDGSGGYRETVDQREARLASAQEDNALFRESLAALEEQHTSFGKSVQQQQAARDKAVASTRRLLDQIKVKGSTDKKLRLQLELAEKDLAAVQAQPVKADASAADIAARQRKVQELEQMVKRLRTSVLGAP